MRWLAGGAVLVVLALFARSMLEDAEMPTEVAEAGTEAAMPAPAPAGAVAAATPASPAPATVPAPTAAATPAAAVAQPAVAAAKPAPAPVAVAAVAPPPPEKAVIESLPAAKPVSDYEAFTRVESTRLDFMGQFRSYASVDDVFNQLEKGGFAPALTSNHRKVPEEFPPYHLDRIDVREYKHLGAPGQLTMQFFNDRLFEAEFEPEDADAYHGAFQRKYPSLRPNKIGRAELLNGYLRMASSLDLAVSDVGRTLHTRPFALWQDRRLVVQRDGWDARYAKELSR